MEHMERYQWPGNIRELENAMERAVLLSKGKYIELDDLPNTMMQVHEQTKKTYKSASLKQAMEEPEKNIIHQALEASNWNRQETAKVLQINRTTLFKKMKYYGLYDEAERLGLA